MKNGQRLAVIGVLSVFNRGLYFEEYLFGLDLKNLIPHKCERFTNDPV